MRIYYLLAFIITMSILGMIYLMALDMGWKFDIGLILGLGLMYVYHRIKYGFWMNYGD